MEFHFDNIFKKTKIPLDTKRQIPVATENPNESSRILLPLANEKQLLTDSKDLNGDIESAIGEIKLNLPAVLKDEAVSDVFDKLSLKVYDYLGLHSMTNSFKEEIIKSNNINENNLFLLNALDIGAKLLIYDSLEGVRNFSIKKSFEQQIDKYLQLHTFAHAGEIPLTIDDISLKDIDKKPEEELPLTQLFKSSMTCLTDVYDESYSTNEIQSENKELKKQYPTTSIAHIVNLLNSRVALLILKPEDFDDFISKHNGIQRKAAEKAKYLIKKAHSLSERIRETVLNPSLDDFSPLRDALTVHLKGKEIERNFALEILGLESKNKVIETFRKSQELIEQNNNSEFYKLLNSSIKEYINGQNVDGEIVMADDLPAIFDTEKASSQSEENIVKIEEFRPILLSIISKSSIKDYRLDPKEINLGNIYAPQSISVTLDKDRPDNKFSVNLHFEDTESLDFSITYDIKRNTSTWTFLETPDTTHETKDFYKGLLTLTESVLLKVKDKAADAFAKKQQERAFKAPISPIQSDKNGKSVKSSISIEHDKNGNGKNTNEHITPIKNILMGSYALPNAEKQGLHKAPITVPDEESFDKMTKGFSPTDKELIREDLLAYNDVDRKDFQWRIIKLEHTKRFPDNYRLVIGNKIRLILKKTNSHFEIVDIYLRKDAYKKR
jgi:hypothetical protein